MLILFFGISSFNCHCWIQLMVNLWVVTTLIHSMCYPSLRKSAMLALTLSTKTQRFPISTAWSTTNKDRKQLEWLTVNTCSEIYGNIWLEITKKQTEKEQLFTPPRHCFHPPCQKLALFVFACSVSACFCFVVFLVHYNQLLLCTVYVLYLIKQFLDPPYPSGTRFPAKYSYASAGPW